MSISEDKKRKYSNTLIVKILLIIQIYGVSFRSSEKFFNNHPDIMEAVGFSEIPNFKTFSTRRIHGNYNDKESSCGFSTKK